MKNTIIGLAVLAAVAGASSAFAQPAYPPAGESFHSGSYQLDARQVWVDGQCSQVRQWNGYVQQHCEPGFYQTVENWVWVRYHRPAVRIALPLPLPVPVVLHTGPRYAPSHRYFNNNNRQVGRYRANNSHAARPVKNYGRTHGGRR